MAGGFHIIGVDQGKQLSTDELFLRVPENFGKLRINHEGNAVIEIGSTDELVRKVPDLPVRVFKLVSFLLDSLGGDRKRDIVGDLPDHRLLLLITGELSRYRDDDVAVDLVPMTQWYGECRVFGVVQCERAIIALGGRIVGDQESAVGERPAGTTRDCPLLEMRYHRGKTSTVPRVKKRLFRESLIVKEDDRREGGPVGFDQELADFVKESNAVLLLCHEMIDVPDREKHTVEMIDPLFVVLGLLVGAHIPEAALFELVYRLKQLKGHRYRLDENKFPGVLENIAVPRYALYAFDHRPLSMARKKHDRDFFFCKDSFRRFCPIDTASEVDIHTYEITGWRFGRIDHGFDRFFSVVNNNHIGP